MGLFKRPKTGGRETGVVPLGVFETKPQNILMISPEWGAVWSSWSPLGGSWSEVARETQGGSGWGNRFLSSFFKSLVQSQLKLLQLRTAHQSINQSVFVQIVFPPLVARAVLWPNQRCGN